MQAHLRTVKLSLQLKFLWMNFACMYLSDVIFRCARMEAKKTVFKIIIILLTSSKHLSHAESSLDIQKYFKKTNEHGNVMRNESLLIVLVILCMILRRSIGIALRSCILPFKCALYKYAIIVTNVLFCMIIAEKFFYEHLYYYTHLLLNIQITCLKTLL